MIRDIHHSFNIDSFAFVNAADCKTANLRLRKALPDDANVIFMLFPYYFGNGDGNISAYGAVQDYHSFAAEVFSKLSEYFTERYPSKLFKGFSDHSPYLECEGAALAGLGFLGENSLLITEKYSSFVFIGEAVTTLSDKELAFEGVPKGTGAIKRCEGCMACVRACPSGCVGKAERDLCISSLTQKKAPLSDDEKKLIKAAGSIWGCDICQNACPHTKKALREGTIYTDIAFFKNSYIGKDPTNTIEKMDDDTFSLYPFSWRKREIIQRNIDILQEEN